MKGLNLITGLAKLVICTAVIISFVTTVNLSAALTFTLDADTLVPGVYPASSPLVFATPGGNVTFVGEIVEGVWDIDFITAGASGRTFDIIGPDDVPPGDRTAELFFDFYVESVEFVYGGNHGDLYVEAQDIGGGMLASFYQASTVDGQPAGPETLSYSGIRRLYWTDNLEDQDYASLDNIVVTIPEPATVALLGIGSLVLFRSKRK